MAVISKKVYKVFIVDDHEIVRKGLRSILELENDIEVIGEASSGEEAIRQVDALDVKPDLVIMDLKMPGMGGVDATKEIKEKYPDLNILILTAFEDDDHMFECIELGVSGFLLKDMEHNELVSTIRTICEGHSVLDPAVTRKVFSKLNTLTKFGKSKDEAHLLTDRETDVLKLMAKGHRNQDIASMLWVSEGTIKTHVSNILRKLNQADRAQAVIAAFKLGIIEPEELNPFSDNNRKTRD